MRGEYEQFIFFSVVGVIFPYHRRRRGNEPSNQQRTYSRTIPAQRRWPRSPPSARSLLAALAAPAHRWERVPRDPRGRRRRRSRSRFKCRARPSPSSRLSQLQRCRQDPHPCWPALTPWLRLRRVPPTEWAGCKEMWCQSRPTFRPRCTSSCPRLGATPDSAHITAISLVSSATAVCPAATAV
ncbi:hypothetical protein BC830DRAFT_803931 [Chytriomyces sp. MP71]|nr:hypothetical protein BC830DRAFT_803931 [Chytriomyces sp. MP71]